MPRTSTTYYNDTGVLSDANIDLVSYTPTADTPTAGRPLPRWPNLNTKISIISTKALDIGRKLSASLLIRHAYAIPLTPWVTNNVHSGSFWAWRG